MKFEKISIEDGLDKEWIITNGIGGYAYSTIFGANTRRYHGLLVAAMTPPARRFVILSKVDEAIEIGGVKYNLYTDITKNYMSEGYKYLESFEKDVIPTFRYKIKDTVVEKTISLVYGENTVVVKYHVVTGKEPARLTITPLMNYRDFHSENFNHEYNIDQKINDRKVRVVIDDNKMEPIYMYVDDGIYIKHNNDAFRNMFYIEEEKRGFNPEENHAIPGRYEIDISSKAKKDITFICSLDENIEEIEADKVFENEKARIKELYVHSGISRKIKDTELSKNYIVAADNFVVNRPSFGLHTLIAGYPWFLDWGRDSLISFEGLLLLTKRFDIAREVLLTSVRDIKYGLVPNGYSGYDNRPLYNSADASLLLFEQVYKYIQYTKDYDFVQKKMMDKLRKVISAYCAGIDVDNNNIYLDKDGLINSGTSETQNTWMDVKIGEYVVTPRSGKVVEINALWYNALKIMEELEKKYNNPDEANQYKKMADKAKRAFTKVFYNEKRKCLYDVEGDNKVRPNQLFALSLSHPVISPSNEMAENIIRTCAKKLVMAHGLKTLAKGEENYVDTYEGDPFRRDMSYHQGPTWPWLAGLYFDSIKKVKDKAKTKTSQKELNNMYEDFVETIKKTFIKEFISGKTIGGIPEVYDSRSPYIARAASQQAWSVAEIFRIIITG